MKTDQVRQVCRCGSRSRAYARTGNLGEIADATGFGFVWDVHNGLEAIWLCPGCFEKVETAWRSIVELLGTDMLSMTGVLRQRDRRAQGAQ